MGGSRHAWIGVILLSVLTTLPPVPGLARFVYAGEPGAWAGIYPTVITPFCGPEGGVDVVSLEQQIRRELGCGVHGLLVLGTFGEGQFVAADERAQVIATAVRLACGVPVVVGIHTCDFDTARQQLLQAQELGAAAVLVKYIGNPQAPFAQVCGFYAALGELNALPIIYYHYPAQTGLNLSTRQICQLLSLPNVIGMKESILDLGEMRQHLHQCRGLHKAFFCSTALQLTQFLGLGGQGAMCPEAALLPCPVVQAYEAYTHGEHAEARAIQKQLYELSPILRTRAKSPTLTRLAFMTAADLKLPVPMSQGQTQAKVKCALTCFGVPTPTWVKCPLPPLTVRDQGEVQAAMRALNAIDWAEVALRVPPVPLYSAGTPYPGGGFLRPGAFMLGPGATSDMYRSPGDTLLGFPRW